MTYVWAISTEFELHAFELRVSNFSIGIFKGVFSREWEVWCGTLQWVPGHFANDTLPKDILPKKHFAERTICQWTFCRTDTLTKVQLDERIFCGRDILPIRQIAQK